MTRGDLQPTVERSVVSLRDLSRDLRHDELISTILRERSRTSNRGKYDLISLGVLLVSMNPSQEILFWKLAKE